MLSMKSLKSVFNERNMVVILFVMVFIAFAFAQKESKKIEKLYLGFRLHNSLEPHFTSADKNSETAARIQVTPQEIR